jgi:hypothetical protein
MSWFPKIFKSRPVDAEFVEQRWVFEFNKAQVEADGKEYSDITYGIPGEEVWSFQEGYWKFDWEKAAKRWYTTKTIKYWYGPKPEEEGEEISRRHFQKLQAKYNFLYKDN